MVIENEITDCDLEGNVIDFSSEHEVLFFFHCLHRLELALKMALQAIQRRECSEFYCFTWKEMPHCIGFVILIIMQYFVILTNRGLEYQQ